MAKKEILATRYGEMLDMINCIAIAEGDGTQERKPETDLAKILFSM